MPTETYSEKLLFDGAPLLCITLRLPATSHESINVFLSELKQRVESWCKSTLFDALCADFSADPDPKRRFHHRSFYELDITLLSDTQISISASLKTPKTRLSHNETVVFDPTSGLILPPKRARKSKK
ncbi:MAG: hypothetical protein IKB47_01800 [Clostridia bacterium]|nr:hypothetical protein [Clostridia bacterium]